MRVYPQLPEAPGKHPLFNVKSYVIGGASHDKLAILTETGQIIIFDIGTAKIEAAFFPTANGMPFLGIKRMGFDSDGVMFFATNESGTVHFVVSYLLEVAGVRSR